MADDETLIPVFVPPLANVLAFAEKKKGSPLSEPEVKDIRGKSVCIIMPLADADKMNESRGFVDVNPENYWADWHRLRVQMTGRGYLPKIVLCIPGDEEFRDRSEAILKAEGIEHEFTGHNEKLVQAFKVSSMTWGGFTAEDYVRINAHTTVLYVLSKNFVATEAPEIGLSFLKLGRRLLEAGGIVIKSESSGISHPAARWVLFSENAQRNTYEKWSALYHAYVVSPIGSKTELYTCGMHLLGWPDLIVSQSVIQGSIKAEENAATAAVRLFRIFALYLMDECPVGTFGSGHTFSVEKDSPRYRMVWEPCSGYKEDDFFFNPFGRWRFTGAEMGNQINNEESA